MKTEKICHILRLMSFVFLFVFSLGIAVCAENLENKTEWNISASSEIGRSAYNTIDGDKNTYWHSKYETDESNTIISRDEPPFRIIIELPKAEQISGVIYTPRQDLSVGRAERVNIYLAYDNPENAMLVKSNARIYSILTYDSTISFGKTYEARYIVFEIIQTKDGYGTVAELNLVKGTASPSPIEGTVIAPLKGKEEGYLIDGISVIDRSEIKCKASSYAWEVGDTLTDGENSSYWHSEYWTDDDGNITDQTYPPYELEFDFGKIITISGFIYTPRQDRDLGRMLEYEVYAANSENSDYYLIDEGTATGSADNLVSEFLANVKIRKFKLVITKAMGNYGTCAEMNFIAPDDSKETFALSEYTLKRMISRENIYKSIKTSSGEDILSLVTDKTATTYFLKTSVSSEYYIIAELTESMNISGFSVSPYRKFDQQGLWLTFDVQTSTDGETYFSAGNDYTMATSGREQFFKFDGAVTAKFIKFIIRKNKGNAISVSDLKLYQSMDVYKEDVSENAKVYKITAGSNMLKEEGVYGETEISMEGIAYEETRDLLVPLSVFEEIGAEVSFVADGQKIYISYSGQSIEASFEMRIWDNVVTITDNDPTTYDTVRYTTRTEPRFYGNSIPYVPFEFVMRHLKFDVEREDGVAVATSDAMNEWKKISILEPEELFPVEKDEIAPYDNWLITSDAVHTNFPDCVAECAMDGSLDTRWVAPYIGFSGSTEQQLTIDMREARIVSGVRVYLTNWSLYNSYPTKVSVYVSDDGEEWTLKKSESFENDTGILVQNIDFGENISTRFIRYSVTETVGTGTSDAGVVFVPEIRILKENLRKVTLSMVADAAKKQNGEGIMRFVAEFTDIPLGVEVEYYGIYILPTAVFDGTPAFADNIPYVKFKAAPYVGGTFSVDLDKIPEEYYSMPVTAVAFVKQKNIDGYVYSYISDETQTVSMLSLIGNLGHGIVEYEEVER